MCTSAKRFARFASTTENPTHLARNACKPRSTGTLAGVDENLATNWHKHCNKPIKPR
jgi:hypothetical protein